MSQTAPRFEGRRCMSNTTQINCVNRLAWINHAPGRADAPPVALKGPDIVAETKTCHYKGPTPFRPLLQWFGGESKIMPPMRFLQKTGRWLPASSLLWLGLFFTACGQQVAPAQVTLAWNASADRTVVGYYFYYGDVTHVYTNRKNVGTNKLFSVSGLVPGTTYYFTVTSCNAAGLESAYATEISYAVPRSASSKGGVISTVAGGIAGGVLGNPTDNNGSATLPATVDTPVTLNYPIALPGGNVQLTFAGGDAGVSYEVQVSTDLFNWTTLTNIVADDNGLPACIDTGATNGLRFYRTVTP